MGSKAKALLDALGAVCVVDQDSWDAYNECYTMDLESTEHERCRLLRAALRDARTAALREAIAIVKRSESWWECAKAIERLIGEGDGDES